MKPMLMITMIFSAFMAGCSSLAIYETEKISITVEARGDASQPVSANIGLKQRVALIVPGTNGCDSTGNGNSSPGSDSSQTEQKEDKTKKDKANKDKLYEDKQDSRASRRCPGKAVSAISFFDFFYKEKKITIDTVLLTGNAAPTDDNAKNVFKTISEPVGSAKFKLTKTANMTLMYNGLKEIGDKTAIDHVAALDKLEKYIPDKYPFTRYVSKSGESDNFKEDNEVKAGASITHNRDFLLVSEYLGNLDYSISALDHMINTQQLKINDKILEPETTFKDGLKLKKTELEVMRDKKHGEIYGSPSFKSAFNYYIKKLKE